MINSLLETQFASKYYAIYISGLYLSDKNYIPSSNISNIIKNYVDNEMKTQDWKNMYDKLNNEFKSNSQTIPELDSVITKCQNNLKSWNDLLKLYVLVATVSDICSNFDCRVAYVNKCIDACSDKIVTNWIILHGGWNAYYSINQINSSNITKYNFTNYQKIG